MEHWEGDDEVFCLMFQDCLQTQRLEPGVSKLKVWFRTIWELSLCIFPMSPLMMNQKGWHCLMRNKLINDWIFLSRSCCVLVLFKPHDIFRSTLFYEMFCIWVVHVKRLKCCEKRLTFCSYRFLTSFWSFCSMLL